MRKCLIHKLELVLVFGVSQISVRHVNHEPLKNQFVQQNACSSGEDAHDIHSLESQKKLTVQRSLALHWL